MLLPDGGELVRPLAFHEVFQQGLGPLQAFGRLLAGRLLVLLLQHEQRVIGPDLAAALHRQCCQAAGKGRRHAHELAFGIAGITRCRVVIATAETDRQCGKNSEQARERRKGA
jgi:hypothetical protein